MLLLPYLLNSNIFGLLIGKNERKQSQSMLPYYRNKLNKEVEGLGRLCYSQIILRKINLYPNTSLHFLQENLKCLYKMLNIVLKFRE